MTFNQCRIVFSDTAFLEKCFCCVFFRDSSETSKIQMDPTRDDTNPYVGLAFKLEVSCSERLDLFRQMSSSHCVFAQQEGLIWSCFVVSCGRSH